MPGAVLLHIECKVVNVVICGIDKMGEGVV